MIGHRILNGLIGLALLCLVGTFAYFYFSNHPGVAVLSALGTRQEVRWKRVPVSAFRHPPWGPWKLDHIRAGKGTTTVHTWKDGRHTESTEPAPEGPTKDFRQRLLTLQVSGPLGNPTPMNVLVVAEGRVSPDGKQYSVDLADVSGVSTGYWLAYVVDFDREQRVLSVRVGWAMPGEDGNVCALRYRLTPSGFELLDAE